MSALAKARYFWRSAAQGIRHAPFVHFVAVITIALALFATGLTRAAISLVDSVAASLGGQIELTVYLRDEAEAAQVQSLLASLQEHTGGTPQVVGPELALQRLVTELGELGSALRDLPENPLPASIEVQVPQGARAPAALRAYAEELRRRPEVSAVDYGQEAVERLSALAAGLRLGGLLAFALVVLTTVVVVSATLQLAIYARREEIEIQKLVGATNRFVKTPFLIEGLLQGLLGAGVAMLALWACSTWLGPRVLDTLAFLTGPLGSFRLLQPRLLLELAAVGAALGLGGSFIAVGRFLRV